MISKPVSPVPGYTGYTMAHWSFIAQLGTEVDECAWQQDMTHNRFCCTAAGFIAQQQVSLHSVRGLQ